MKNDYEYTFTSCIEYPCWIYRQSNLSLLCLKQRFSAVWAVSSITTPVFSWYLHLRQISQRLLVGVMACPELYFSKPQWFTAVVATHFCPSFSFYNDYLAAMRLYITIKLLKVELLNGSSQTSGRCMSNSCKTTFNRLLTQDNTDRLSLNIVLLKFSLKVNLPVEVHTQAPLLPNISLVFSYANNFALTERMQYQLQETRLLCHAHVSSWPLLFKSNHDAKPGIAADIANSTFVYYSLYKETDKVKPTVNRVELLSENKVHLF